MVLYVRKNFRFAKKKLISVRNLVGNCDTTPYRYALTSSLRPQNKDIQKCIFLLKVRKGFFQSAMFLASALKRGSHPPENILKI